MNLRLLAVDDDPEFLLFLKVGLQKICHLLTASSLKEAFALIKAQPLDMVLLDVGLGEENGLDVLREIKNKQPQLDVVMVSGHKDPKIIVEAIQRGAADYLTKPFEIEELFAIIEKNRPLRSMREANAALIEALNDAPGKMIGASAAFQSVLEKAQLVRGHKASILIEGESGTGKEILARHIHHLEQTPSRPFIAVNCAAIPENLLESELFGHERGSFTGAYSRKIGKFELANGGDIFLDEISSLKCDLQAKILRALQEKEISRIGGNETISIDFRVIAATNEDLEKAVEDGRFRRDLYHRLRVIQLKVPPLRERADDIPQLISYFLRKHDPRNRRSLSAEAAVTLRDYGWPGNIRELEHLIQSLVILSPHAEIQKADLPEWVFRKRSPLNALNEKDFVLPEGKSELIPLKGYIDKAERAYVLRALEITRGDKSKAAVLLNISRTTLHERLKVWGMGEC